MRDKAIRVGLIEYEDETHRILYLDVRPRTAFISVPSLKTPDEVKMFQLALRAVVGRDIAVVNVPLEDVRSYTLARAKKIITHLEQADAHE